VKRPSTKKPDPKKELIFILLCGFVIFAISARYDIFEKFIKFSNAHDKWQIDEILVLMSALFFAFLVFSVRRWRELAQSDQELRMRNEALEKSLIEIKRLRGILPICAACKKIRDDQGYWHQVEMYLHEHSDVEFSHSICPDCARKLYPDFSEESFVSGGNPDEGI
jgi:hypothetical protein